MPIKVALGISLQAGAYGGANQFGTSLRRYLTERGLAVVTDLQSPDIDIVFITDTRPWLKTCAFAGAAALDYVKRHPAAKIIFRVNECDQKRGTTLKVLNHLIAQHARLADQVVYISGWLQELFTTAYTTLQPTSVVIRNGGDTTIFNPDGYKQWTGHEPLRLVTHHWSSNPYKGLDVYQQLDNLLGTRYRGQLECTFIGNVPAGARFSFIKHVPALNGKALAQKIKQHHVYLTASLHEPAGMHHIEGALCGLPLLYRQSGALPEYCASFGVGFSGPTDFEVAIETMRQNYPSIVNRMSAYTHTADRMCAEYYDLITKVATQPPRTSARVPGPLLLTATSSTLFLKETAHSLLRNIF